MNPNSHFDPTTQLVLNPAAWSDVDAGQFGTAPAFLINYRWQRQPAESMSFGRLFPLTKERKATLQIRIEFQNVFNRLFYSTPSDTNLGFLQDLRLCLRDEDGERAYHALFERFQPSVKAFLQPLLQRADLLLRSGLPADCRLVSLAFAGYIIEKTGC